MKDGHIRIGTTSSANQLTAKLTRKDNKQFTAEFLAARFALTAQGWASTFAVEVYYTR